MQLEDFVEATQKMQAFALQTAIEHFRRRKYECSGAMFWQFNEPWPAISWSIIDYYRNPKLAYHKLKDIYSPVLASLKYEFKEHVAGETLPIEAWIVNDLHHPIEDCRLDIHMGGNGERPMNLSFNVGTIPADSSQPYLRFGLRLPDRPEWLLCTTLRSGNKTLSTNSYDLKMWDPGEASLWNRIYDRMSKWVLL
jgi:beta-mannosidase